MQLIFELSKVGRSGFDLPACDVPVVNLSTEKRSDEVALPEVSEIDLVRHYTRLSRRAHGVDNGFYPLGSCTMKYNPKLNEYIAGFPGFTDIHPLQPLSTVKGCLESMTMLSDLLCSITGMNAVTLQPAAGAHGEFTGLLLIDAYHKHRNDHKRKKVIIPDAAHGTNPASAVMAGYDVINIPSLPNGMVDVEALRKVVGEDTAALMLTNPNTLGIFDKNILEITEIVHKAGGLVYYDGANLNAIMGIVRPGDMGFDVIHLNLHKTFSTPHGGGGPGSGAVGCKDFLQPFLPYPTITESNLEKSHDSIGKVKAFYGNFLVNIRALSYILTLGAEGIKDAAEKAVLNANYLLAKVSDIFEDTYDEPCMHEFVISAEKLKKETGISALHIAKAMLDYGIHPPTVYFPLIVHEALMFEPTETETMETLDEVADVLHTIYREAYSNPEKLLSAPHTTPVSKADEVKAARTPILKK